MWEYNAIQIVSDWCVCVEDGIFVYDIDLRLLGAAAAIGYRIGIRAVRTSPLIIYHSLTTPSPT